jgi:hypothetical protein
MAIPTEQILRELGQKMRDEIDLLLRRNAEERAKLLNASTRLEELASRDAVLLDERRRLIARGEARVPENDSRLFATEDKHDDSRHGSIDSPTP